MNSNVFAVVCMVCGTRFETVAESMEHDHLKSGAAAEQFVEVEQFEEIWEAENLVCGEKASIACAKAGTPLFVKGRNATNLQRAKQRLFALIDALSPEQAKAYGRYRNGILAEIAAMS